MSKPTGKRGVTSKTGKSASAAAAAAAAASAAGSAAGGAGDEPAERTTPGTSKSASGDIDLRGADDGAKDGGAAAAKGADGEAVVAPKPQSAGASVRDAAQKLLGLTMRAEWTPVEQVVKNLEKAVAASGDDASLVPLAGVLDQVR